MIEQIRPLGHRIVVIPDKPVEQTRSGFVIPEAYRDMPAMSGIVYRLGDGPERDKRIRASTIARCLSILDDALTEYDHDPSLALDVAREEIGRYLRDASDSSEHVCAAGQRVVFPMEAGHEIVLNERVGDPVLIISEDSVLAVHEAEEVAAPCL